MNLLSVKLSMFPRTSGWNHEHIAGAGWCIVSGAWSRELFNIVATGTVPQPGLLLFADIFSCHSNNEGLSFIPIIRYGLRWRKRRTAWLGTFQQLRRPWDQIVTALKGHGPFIGAYSVVVTTNLVVYRCGFHFAHFNLVLLRTSHPSLPHGSTQPEGALNLEGSVTRCLPSPGIAADRW